MTCVYCGFPETENLEFYSVKVSVTLGIRFFGDHRKKSYIKKVQEFILNLGQHTDMYCTQFLVCLIELINILLQLLNQTHTPKIAMCSGINQD